MIYLREFSDSYCYPDHTMGRKKKQQFQHLKWLFDEKAHQYTLNLSPLILGIVYERKNGQGLFKWYGRIISTDVYDIQAEFDSFDEVKDYVVAMIQSMFLSTAEALFGSERAYERNN